MFIVNGKVTVLNQQFWRIDNLNTERLGIEMLQKPSLLLLCEDHDQASVDKVIKALNAE